MSLFGLGLSLKNTIFLPPSLTTLLRRRVASLVLWFLERVAMAVVALSVQYVNLSDSGQIKL